ncbi:unnamed protein product [Rotaria sordida]|uniref:Uncharacterized protein n=2 Tax=Rotaria sordida TaxID=392033 RepID=A0A814JHR5_9BILA|nr:unnamed protein product [Rotaria sordida]CAF0901303.1 unnamed protein product [Rotaria sordida]CAF1035702.1 unnamed protein product [Rotaria sordida]
MIFCQERKFFHLDKEIYHCCLPLLNNMIEKTTITMNCSKVIFYIVLVICIIQVELSFQSRDINSDMLKKLVLAASKSDDCSRRVAVQEPIPLRFRRAPIRDKFPCVIKVK